MTLEVGKNPLRRVEEYYQATRGSYFRWGQDPNRTGLYSLHFGFEDQSQQDLEFDNRKALVRLTDKFIDFAEIKNGMRVLDSGCGTGTVSYRISERYPGSRVYGINISKLQLQEAIKYNCRNQNSPFFIGQDYHNMGLELGAFDLVIFCESLIHSPQKEKLLQESAKILRPGGLLVLSDYFRVGNATDDVTQKWWQNLKTGWEIPNFAEIDGFNKIVERGGFGEVRECDLSTNIMRSADLLGDGCKAKLEKGGEMSDIIRGNRIASVAFRDLLKSEQLGYLFVKAIKT